MANSEPTHFAQMQQRYRSGDMPWDAVLPPPEIIAIATRLSAGHMLDLGCGTARASVYLAARGWQADAVDFVPEAIAMARARVQAAGHEQHVRLHLASVTDLHMLHGPYDLAVDVGCMHGLDDADQQRYAAEVARLVSPGGTYMLFAHLRPPADAAVSVGVPAGTIEGLFAASFRFTHVAHGTTMIGDDHRHSAWYELTRR